MSIAQTRANVARKQCQNMQTTNETHANTYENSEKTHESRAEAKPTKANTYETHAKTYVNRGKSARTSRGSSQHLQTQHTKNTCENGKTTQTIDKTI